MYRKPQKYVLPGRADPHSIKSDDSTKSLRWVGDFIQWYCSFLINRQQLVRVNNTHTNQSQLAVERHRDVSAPHCYLHFTPMIVLPVCLTYLDSVNKVVWWWDQNVLILIIKWGSDVILRLLGICPKVVGHSVENSFINNCTKLTLRFADKIATDPSHVLHEEYQLLPSGKLCRVPGCKKSTAC